MHKKTLLMMLLVCLTFLLVGCTRIDNTDDYHALIDKCLVDRVVTNQVSLGYKYYIPRGVKLVRDYQYNQVFLVDDVSIYLYVDIISYYYKKDLKFDKSDQSVYYEKIDKNGKVGYVDIVLVDDVYYVKMLYNYSKIEAYVDKGSLNKVVALGTILLNHVKFNDTVIEKVMNGDYGEYSELNYELEKPVDASNSFSQLLEEYVQKEDKKKDKLPDE